MKRNADSIRVGAMAVPTTPMVTPPTITAREVTIGWAIVVASLILAFLVFRVVMIELEVNSLLDELFAEAGAVPLSKS